MDSIIGQGEEGRGRRGGRVPRCCEQEQHVSATRYFLFFCARTYSLVRRFYYRPRQCEKRNGAAAARLAIIAPSANSLVRFKGGRYAATFAEALRAARRNRNIFAAVTIPPRKLLFPAEKAKAGWRLLMREIKYKTFFVAAEWESAWGEAAQQFDASN